MFSIYFKDYFERLHHNASNTRTNGKTAKLRKVKLEFARRNFYFVLVARSARKGSDAKNPAISYQKNPVKCNACAVVRKNETDCFTRNVPITNDPMSR